MATNLKVIRFITGEEIIAEIYDDNNDTLVVKNPIRIVVMPSKTDPKAPQVAFAPYAEFTEDTQFTFSWSHIVTTYNPIAQFVNQYNTVFGGLIVPDTQIIKP